MSSLSFESFKTQFQGKIISPNDAGYEQARSTFIHQGQPALILQPQSTAAVVSALAYVRDTGMMLSVRSGGHSGAGFSTNTGGVVIDLSLLNSIEIIDEKSGHVRVGAGARWGEVAAILKSHHFAISSGDTKTVGVGGLILGGGIGWMVRKYGLAIDSVIGAEVVTADGNVLHTDATNHPDLFWAIRGGGGNFGILTAVEFEAQKISSVFAGPIVYPRENIGQIITGWRDVMREAPEELTTMLLIMPAFPGTPASVTIMCCYAGDDKNQAMQVIEPLRQLGQVVKDEVKEKAYADVLEEAHPPQGVRIIVNNGFVETFSDEVVKTLAQLCQTHDNLIFQIRSLGGKMNQVPVEDTAFAHRQNEVLVILPTFVPPDATVSMITTAVQPWQKLERFMHGAYVNFFSENTGEELGIAYPPTTLKKLAHIKKLYDPENLFNQNYNVKPA